MPGWVRAALSYVVALVALLPACGGDAPENGGSDAGTNDAATDGGTLPSPAMPREVAPPGIAPCPLGWTEVALDDRLSYCAPWPADEPACGDGTYRFPGDPACAPLGPPCAPDGWPANDEPAPTIFVRADADTGGDGTRALPFSSIAEALAVAGPGDVIGVAVGEYDGEVRIPEGVTVRGACVEGTRLIASEMHRAIVDTIARDAAVQDVTIGPGFTGLRADGEGELLARNVHVAGASTFGVVAYQGAVVRAEALVVSDVVPTADGDLGMGIIADENGVVHVERGIVERCSSAGALVRTAGASIDLADTVIRDVAAAPVEHLGAGIATQDNAHVTFTRSLIERTLSAGVWTSNGASVELDRSLVRGVAIPDSGDTGNAVMAFAGGTLALRRTAIADAELALTVSVGYRSVIEGSDVLLFQPESVLVHTADLRLGLAVQGAGTLDAERLAVADAYGIAVGVSGPETALRVTDLSAVRTRAIPDVRVGGRALHCDSGSSCSIDGMLAEDSVEVGLLASGAGTTARVNDVTIRRTMSNPWDGSTGRAVSAQFGALVDVTRALFEDEREVAVLSAGEGTTITLTDTTVRHTLPRECAETTCAGYGGGSGLAAVDGGRIDLASFLVTDSALAGLQIAEASTITARDGVVSRNLVGVNNQNPLLDLGALMQNVYFIDNAQNLDSSALPVPGDTL